MSYSRRTFLTTAGLTAMGTLALHGCQSNSDTPNSSPVPSPISGLETTTVRLGFIPLTDAAPLIIAKVKGYFDKYGLTGAEVIKQASWGTTRDNLVLGSAGGGIDGAHILSPMPYLISEGIVTNGKKVPMYILARLNTNGQGIQLSNEYLDLKVGLDASPLRNIFQRKKRENKEVKVAMTFPGGTHDMWIRYWLAAAGIDPNQDVSTIVVPPPQMVANVKVGNMEAFCVGEPWPLQTLNQKVGYSAITTGEFWKDHPEKALGLRSDWVDKHPKATQALLQAVLEAQIWCDQDSNKQEMCEILSQPEWVKAPVADIIDRSLGKFNLGVRQFESKDLMQKYWRDNASYPFKSHDLWFLTENIRWGYLKPEVDTKALVDRVNREDLWREAAKAIGQEAAIPKSTSRGVETFFDQVQFDPENPQNYLNRLKITSLKA